MKLRSHAFAAAAVVAALLAPPLRADGDRACPAIDPPLSPAGQHSSSGWRVFRDPQTGQLRPPTREEAAELDLIEAEAAPESERTFVVIQHPDGMTSVDVRGALMQSVVVTRNPDGSLSFGCVPAGSAFPPAPAPPARPALEEK